MTWIVAAVAGVLALAVAVVLLIGARLPVGHVVARRVRIARRPDEIWQALVDIEAFPSWRPRLKRVEVLDAGDSRPAWREVGKDGSITFEVVEADEPRRLVTRITDPGLPFGGSWSYLLEPDGAGCVVTVAEHGEVRNLVFRFVSRFVFGHHATIEAYLRELGAGFGENVTPQPAKAAAGEGP